MYFAHQNQVIEWSYQTSHTYADPFAEVEVDVVCTAPDGKELNIPAFWAGDGKWSVRFAHSQVGVYHFITRCSDTSNTDLHQQEGSIEVQAYSGDHPLYQHGPLQVAANHRYLQHRDGTPFLWLADTWWMGLCQRLHWPDEFQWLLADRVSKGFNVVHIVAGLYPDMPAFDPRGANEAGFPWTAEFQQINPAYFEMADRRIEALVAAGIVPFMVGCWAYFAHWMGIERMQQHWRYLIARYGAYPVVWCLAGETTMPYYLTTDYAQEAAWLKRTWTTLAAYVRHTDPYHRLITTHAPGVASGREEIEDATLLDFDVLQSGHSDRLSMAPTIALVKRSYAASPTMPVIDIEVNYEGILESSRQEMQRFLFWSCMLSGAAGHSYGANGLWQVNRQEQPYGLSPQGISYGGPPWNEAAQLLGSRQLGLGKRLLDRYPWWQFEPHPEWSSPHAHEEDAALPYAAGIPGKLRMIYFPQLLVFRWGSIKFTVCRLEQDLSYQAFFWNPVNGQEYPIGAVSVDGQGNWQVPPMPIIQDWILILHTD